MRDIWVTSDTHYNHANILNFYDFDGVTPVRPEFSNVNEMNECLLDSWNSVVKPGDIVYHLGDVFMGPKEDFLKAWPKFQGSKRLIVGNHDDIKFMSSGGLFKKVQLIRKFPERGIMFSHIPFQVDSLYNSRSGDTLINVHGHIHQHDSPPGPYRNVCVEKTNYIPLHIDEVSVL